MRPSLEPAINAKNIDERWCIISDFLRGTPVGELSDSEQHHFRVIFEKYYISTNGAKFNSLMMKNISVDIHPGFTPHKCFMYRYDIGYRNSPIYAISTKKLAGYLRK